MELSAEALTGLAVHIGARVLAEAGPGEVVVTATTHDLTADAGIGYESRGSVELRGVSGAPPAVRRTAALTSEMRACT